MRYFYMPSIFLHGKITVYLHTVYMSMSVLAIQIKYKMFDFLTIIHGGFIRNYHSQSVSFLFKEFFLILYRHLLSFSLKISERTME